MRVYHEELFGPVAVLHQVDSADEAIELATIPYGLGSAVYTRDQDQAACVANRLAMGMVGLNTTIKTVPISRSAVSRTPASDENPAIRPRRIPEQEAHPRRLNPQQRLSRNCSYHRPGRRADGARSGGVIRTAVYKS